MRSNELEKQLRERLDALGPAPRAFAELLIDCQGAALRVAPELADPSGSLEIGSIRTWTSSEDRTLRAVLVGMLREMERGAR
jgi:hypothetical protein